MNVRTIHAATMAGALAMVKRQLGPEAVILHTRTVKRGGILGIGARTCVEVTAADGSEHPPHRRRPVQTRRPPGQGADRLPPRRSGLPGRAHEAPPASLAAGDLIRKTYAAAKAELSLAAPPAVALTPGAGSVSDASSLGGLSGGTGPVGALVAPAPSDASTAQLADEMQSVKRMVARMMRQQRLRAEDTTRRGGKGATSRGDSTSASRGSTDLPDKLFDQYLALLEQEVAEELAEEIIQQVHEKLGPPQLADEQAVRQTLREAIAGLIEEDPAAGRVEPSPDARPRTIALIGPTGVGKTTTIAKLAATFKLKQRLKVGLITLDTYRIAAVDQLRTYANIIGVPLHVVANGPELTEALGRCEACDVVLIDTAGRSQRDDPKLQQLDGLIRVADPHEVHLVLSSTCSQTVLLETVDRFSRIRTDRIIFTKLDEAVSFGVLLNVARKVNKKLSYVTTGQEVPHQIEPGRSDRLASLVMGDAGVEDGGDQRGPGP